MKEVVTPPRGYAFYADAKLENLARQTPDPHALATAAKRLLRLIGLVRNDSIYLRHGLHKVFTEALRSVNSKIHIISSAAKIKECDIAAVKGDSFPLNALTDFISLPEKTLLISDCPEGWESQLFGAMQQGIMLSGKHNLILISRPEMQKVSYLASI